MIAKYKAKELRAVSGVVCSVLSLRKFFMRREREEGAQRFEILRIKKLFPSLSVESFLSSIDILSKKLGVKSPCPELMQSAISLRVSISQRKTISLNLIV